MFLIITFQRDKEDKEIDNDEESLAYFTKNLSVTTIIHTSVPIEYPRTSPTGVATIYNVIGWSNPLACFSDVSKLLFYLNYFLTLNFLVINIYCCRYNIQLMDPEVVFH